MVSIIANRAVTHAKISTLSGDKKVITAHAGTIKTWASIDSADKWLKKAGLGNIKLEVSQWSPNQKSMIF